MEAIVNNLIKATGWSIFHSLWQGAIIYGILLLTVMAFPKIRAKVKHNMAYAAMCLIFTCFCVTFFSIFKLPVAEGWKPASDLTLNPAYYEYLSTLPTEISSRTENLFPYLVSVYGIGILFQLLILSAGYKKMLELKYADRSAVPSEWSTVFEQMIKKLNIRQHTEFYLSAKVNVPLVIGYFKPVVLFPFALASQLDLDQVEAILIHELSHIRRNDYLLNLIKTGIETLLFFNPFVWLSGRFINIEREHACDDLVLKFTGTPVTYAHALLKLELLKDKSSPALSMAANGKNQHLYQRIKRITDMKTTYTNAKQQIFAITLTVATVISLAWVKPAQAEKPASSNETNTKAIEIAGLGIKFKMQDLPAVKSAKRVAQLNTDTTKKKHKFKIVTVDANGNKQEYDNIKEVPDSLRNEVLNNTFISFPNLNIRIDSLSNAAVAFTNSPEWKKNIILIQKNGEEMSKKFNSPEFKKYISSVTANAMATSKRFNSADFKKHREAAEKAGQQMSKYFESADWKKQQEAIAKSGEEMSKYFESADWKKQQEAIEKSGEQMSRYFESADWKKKEGDIQKNAEQISKYYNSPEFRKKIEEAKALQNSEEYKALKKKFDAEVLELKKKKAAATDVKTN